MSAPIVEFTDSARRTIDRNFVRGLRNEIVELAELFPSAMGNQVPLGVEVVEWKETPTMSDATISMEFPTPSSDSLGTATTNTVEIPLFSKHRRYDRRARDAILRSGIDTVYEEELAEAFGREVVNYFLNGSASTEPGIDNGLLDQPQTGNGLTFDNSSNTNWENADEMVEDLARAQRVLRTGNAGSPPYRLLMDSDDSDLLMMFDANTRFQAGDVMPETIQTPVLFDNEGHVGTNTAYLIDVDRSNYDYFWLDEGGDIGNPATEEWVEDGESVFWKRWWSGYSPRFKHEEFVVEITFDRA